MQYIYWSSICLNSLNVANKLLILDQEPPNSSQRSWSGELLQSQFDVHKTSSRETLQKYFYYAFLQMSSYKSTLNSGPSSLDTHCWLQWWERRNGQEGGRLWDPILSTLTFWQNMDNTVANWQECSVCNADGTGLNFLCRDLEQVLRAPLLNTLDTLVYGHGHMHFWTFEAGPLISCKGMATLQRHISGHHHYYYYDYNYYYCYSWIVL